MLAYIKKRFRITFFLVVLNTSGLVLGCANPAQAVDTNYEWTQIWGGAENSRVLAVAEDDRNVYAVGTFEGSVDFEPGAGEDIFEALGYTDVFLTVYDADGQYLWTTTWGNGDYDYVFGVSVIDGKVFVTGRFYLSTDFDPTSSEDIHLNLGSASTYLTSYSTTGTYLWTKTWGGEGSSYITPSSITAADGQVMIGGKFNQTIDFDPEITEVFIEPHGIYSDAWLSAFTTEGAYLWTKTWGSGDNDVTLVGLTTIADEVFVAGNFKGTVDFDPGETENELASIGNRINAYSSSFGLDGTYSWTQTWGGTENNMVEIAGITSADDKIFFGGAMSGEVDFQPGDGVDLIGEDGYSGSFFTAYTKGGSYLWTKTWSSTGGVYVYSIGSSAEEIFLGGDFNGLIDFDPTDNENIYEYDDYYPGYLSGFAVDGEYLGTKVIGGEQGDAAVYGIAAADQLYFGGSFNGTIDFDTGEGEDIMESSRNNAFLSTYRLAGDEEENVDEENEERSDDLVSSETTKSQAKADSTADAVPNCTRPIPTSPHLFQINRVLNVATIYFVPVLDRTTHYVVAYGEGEEVFRHATTFAQGDTSGVRSVNIYHLNPWETYSFQIRAMNDCQPSDWSVKLTTKSIGSSQQPHLFFLAN